MASRSAGLLGMPNVGKSTLFNALVRAQVAQAANYPFCTIEPQTALVAVPDKRLDTLARMNKSVRSVGAQIAFTDIAGLIEGASKGAGLGNAFLGNLRSVQSILQVVRCFDDGDVIHVLSNPDPTRDIRIIENELALADLQSIEKRLGKDSPRKAGANKAAAAEAETQFRLLKAIQPLLEGGIPARAYEACVPLHERLAWERLQLLTQKPMVYVCNVGEAHAAAGNDMTAAVKEYVARQDAAHAKEVPPPVADNSSIGSSSGSGKAAAAPASSTPAGAAAPASPTPTPTSRCSVAVLCAKLEAETSVLPDEERAEFLASYGLASTGLDGLIAESARLLRLHTFYTSGVTETRAWSIPLGATAPQAAGAIHSDMEKGFIRAEVMGYGDFIAHGGEAGVKAAGRLRSEGKEYVVQDGDICVFKFNAAQGK